MLGGVAAVPAPGEDKPIKDRRFTAPEWAENPIFDTIRHTYLQLSDQLLDSVYPGLTASDPSCLSPFGVGWDGAAPDGALEFGTSNDRSMTTVVASTGDDDAASALVAEASDALTRCADGTALFTMQGQPVQTTVETTEPTLTGTDESLGWRVTGTVGGGSFTLVGLTARVGGDAVAVVGWDPSSNATNVPLETQMFVDAL